MDKIKITEVVTSSLLPKSGNKNWFQSSLMISVSIKMRKNEAEQLQQRVWHGDYDNVGSG